MSISDSSAKGNANAENKNENESGIQDESQKCKNFIYSLVKIRKDHSNKIIMAHININSLRNKFYVLTNSVTEYKNILMISETNLDDICSHALYHLKDFSNPYMLDGNSHGGRILVQVRDKIPSNLVKLDQKFENFEWFFIELELSKKKQMVA